MNGIDSTCQECGTELEGATICSECGWDSTTAVVRPARRSLLDFFVSGGWRVLVYGAIVVLLVLGHMRYQRTGPGANLVESLRWIAVGDGGRNAELVTIHRAHETAKATARLLVHEMEAPDLTGDWASELRPHATMNVRGWMPLLYVLADTELAPAAVRELFEIRTVDGWGRPYRLSAGLLARGGNWEQDPQVGRDLDLGLKTSFFRSSVPDLGDSDWLRLEMVSAGRDGIFDSSDDLRLISYMPAEITLYLGGSPTEVRRHLERAYVRGVHHFRVEGARWDLIDARILAEFRLETFSLR